MDTHPKTQPITNSLSVMGAGCPCCFWLSNTRESKPDHEPIFQHVERDLRKFLECGILVHGFARARCDECGEDFLIAYSCKGRGVCPSCNTKRMVETAAHLVEHLFPQVPVRQWVITLVDGLLG